MNDTKKKKIKAKACDLRGSRKSIACIETLKVKAQATLSKMAAVHF